MLHYLTRLLILCIIFTGSTTADLYADGHEQKWQISDDIPVADYLDQLAESTGISIVYDSGQLTGKTVPNTPLGINAVSDATTLLSKVGLDLVEVGSKSYIVRSSAVKSKSSVTKPTTKIEVSGVVLDKRNGQSLIGVSILSKVSGAGTTTDIDGKFMLKVEPEEELLFSYIGYTSLSLPAKSESMTVYMEEAAEQLDEVVVIGYGTQKKRDLTGSVSTIGIKELKQLPATGLEQAIQGRAAGVYVTQNSGAPGGAMSIRIRGTASTLSAEPLYVIDGIPIINDNASTSATNGGGQNTNALTTINPNDIESIEILKDASATAIYGARAANGVVLITTRKGKAGQQNVSYETFFGVQELYREIPVMNLQEYARYIQDVNLGDLEEFEDLSLLGDGTRWQDVIFREATMQNHQFSLSGGSEKTRFSFTAGIHNKDGIVVGSNFQRYSTKLSLDHNYSDKIRMGVNILASKTRENITFNDNDKGVIYTALLTPPLVPDRLLSGEFGSPPAGDNIVLTFDNPLANALEVDDVNRKTRVLGSVYGEIDIFPWLTYRTELATDVLFSNHNRFQPAFQRGTLSQISNVTRNNNNSTFWILKQLLTYKQKFNDNHNLTFLAGFEAQEGTYEYLFARRENLPNNQLQELVLGDASTQQVEGGAGHWALLSYFGRFNYSMYDRYLVTGTLRADGSSRFGENNRYGLFPSLAFAWRLSEEPFLKDLNTLDNLKMRLGYGAVGNQEIGLYSFAPLLRGTNVVVGDQLTTGFSKDNIANPDVKWESSVQFNLGLDVGLWANRVEIIVDLYNKLSRDMLLPGIYPATAGGLTAPFINIGEMSNRGVELTINTQNKTGAFDWRTSGNISINQNRVVDLGSTGSLVGVVQQLAVTRTEEGLPIGQYYGFTAVGIFEDVEDINTSAFQETGTRPGDIKFADISGEGGVPDGIINDLDQTFIGSPHPDFVANLTNDFSYKNFDLNIFIRGVFGNEVFNMVRRDIAGTGAWHNQSVDIIDRWTPTNTSGSEPRSNGNDPNGNRRVSTRFVEDGSHIRLANVMLGYNMPQQSIQKLGLSNLRFYVSGQNLMTITGYSGYDPEIGSFNQNPLISGVDNGRFPVARSVTMGLNVNF